MCTPSGSISPEATYSIACVAQPHSGWIRNSASGFSARVWTMSSGRMPAWTWHSPSQMWKRARRSGSSSKSGLALDEGAEPHVGAEEDLGVGAVLGPDVLDHLDRVGGGAAVVGLGLHLGRGVDVHHHQRARVLGLPGAQLVGVDRVGERAAGVEVGDQHLLLGREDRGRLGHEVDAAEGDRVGARWRLPRARGRASRPCGRRRPEPRAAGSCGRGSPRCARRRARGSPRSGQRSLRARERPVKWVGSSGALA